MHYSERYEKILELVRRYDFVDIHEIRKNTGASEATVRRDIVKLSETGQVERFHGGIRRGPLLKPFPDGNDFLPFSLRRNLPFLVQKQGVKTLNFPI